jgi:HEAT repeat protein
MNTKATSSLKTHIAHLIADLGDDDGLIRQRARLQLEHIGSESTSALLEALQSQNAHARWEAVRALGELCIPETAAAITSLLMDEDTGVRWAAMESLIHMGRASLRPLLDAFIKNFDSPWMREGLRHILRVFNDRNLLRNREIILFEELEKQAIPGFDASWNSQQAWAAEKALEVLDQDAVQSR